MLELASPHGQLELAGIQGGSDPREEPVGTAEPEPGSGGPEALGLCEGIEIEQAVDVLARRAAAVVAHAVEEQRLLPAGRQLGERRLDVLVERATRPAVLVRDPGREDARAVGRLPPEDLARELELMRLGPHEDVLLETGPSQDLGERRRMAEAVGVVARR